MAKYVVQFDLESCVFGPFETADEAKAFAEKSEDHWKIITLRPAE